MNELETTRSKLLKEFNMTQKSIDSRLSKIRIAGQESIDLAIKNGEILVKLKDTFPHGEWTLWAKENIHINVSQRQCHRYVYLCENKARLNSPPGTNIDSPTIFTGIKQAYSFIKEEIAEEKRQIESQKMMDAREAFQKEQEEKAERFAKAAKAFNENNADVIVEEPDEIEPEEYSEPRKTTKSSGFWDGVPNFREEIEKEESEADEKLVDELTRMMEGTEYNREITAIAESLKLTDEKIVKKVRKYLSGLLHPDKVGNKYKDAMTKLNEVA